VFIGVQPDGTRQALVPTAEDIGCPETCNGSGFDFIFC
jgi:hypothetical protein